VIGFAAAYALITIRLTKVHSLFPSHDPSLGDRMENWSPLTKPPAGKRVWTNVCPFRKPERVCNNRSPVQPSEQNGCFQDGPDLAKPSIDAMKNPSLLFFVLAYLLVAAPAPVRGQSIGRIRQSINKATGGAAPAPAKAGQAGGVQATAVAVDPQAQKEAQAQAAAASALYDKKNKEASVGVDQRVIDFLKKRIDDGSADAAYDLGKRYEEGKGVEADPVEARRLYKLSAERGNEDAVTWLKEHPDPDKDSEKEPGKEPAKEVEAAKDGEPAKDAEPAKTVEPAKPEK
jgi:hypothetical protein